MKAFFAGGGDQVLLTGARALLAEPDETFLGQRRELPVHLAAGDAEEGTEALTGARDELPAGGGTVVEQTEQGGGCCIQFGHALYIPTYPRLCPQWSADLSIVASEIPSFGPIRSGPQWTPDTQRYHGDHALVRPAASGRW